jgi:Xaa-Pro aminopeptidase
MLFLCRASPLLQRTALSSPLRSSLFNRTFANSAVRFSIEMETVDTSERLAQLRELMKRNNLDVYSEFALLPFLWSWTIAHPSAPI